MAKDRDDKQEALADLVGGDPGGFCADWHDALEQASDEEKPWREQQADDATKAYKGEPGSGSTAFNLFHSNIETLVPALYNSSPIPDVRRRFLDDDKVAAQVAEILERSISFSIDDYDFDDTMKGVVKDMAVVDRGIARIKYEPTEENGTVTYEEAKCSYVPWRQFRRGPATVWDEVPWLAFEHYLPKAEVEKLVKSQGNALAYPQDVQAEILGELKYSYSAEAKGDNKDGAKTVPRFGSRERVWEIWDKDTRTVVWLSHDYKDRPLMIQRDPLGLRGFFPCPRPAMVIQATDSLTPITSYSIYCKLIDELNQLSDRIAALTEQLKARGGYAGVLTELEQIARANDGEMIPLSNAELFATTGGGLDKAVVWWPIDTIIAVLKELVQQRELVKQTIYEVTGLSDIIRGATDAKETATAQQIKQQWGSVRIQAHQKEVERYARDLFRLKAEVMCKHFSLETLLLMTGLKYPTREEQQRAQEMKAQGEQMAADYQAQAQAAEAAGQPAPPPPVDPQEVAAMAKQIEEILSKPALEDIAALMQNDRVLKYRVDIESDSTIRADLTRNQEQMKGFLEGTAAYATAVGPMVQEGVMDPQVAVEIFSAFARNFRLGKQAEDALDQWADKIKQQGVQGKPPDPTVQAEAEKLVAETEKIRTETALLPEQARLDREERQARFRLDATEKKATFALNARAQQHAEATGQQDIALRRGEQGLKQQEIEQQGRLGEAQLTETRRAREDGQQLERIKLRDSRQARVEGYQAAQVPDEQGRMPPLPEQQELEDGYMTTEEREMMQALAQGQQQMMQMMMQAMQQMTEVIAQSQQQTAGAIQQLAQIMAAPKVVVRDGSGRAVGTKVAA